MEAPRTANINPAWLPLDGQNKAWVGLVAGQFGAPSEYSFVGGNRHFVHLPDSYTLPHVMLEPTSPTIQVTQQAVPSDMRTLCPPATQLPW